MHFDGPKFRRRKKDSELRKIDADLPLLAEISKKKTCEIRMFKTFEAKKS